MPIKCFLYAPAKKIAALCRASRLDKEAELLYNVALQWDIVEYYPNRAPEDIKIQRFYRNKPIFFSRAVLKTKKTFYN